MKSCQKYQKEFVSALYGELPSEQRSRFEAHLKTCVECAAAFAHMKSTLELMDQRIRPEPEAAYWNTCWERLRKRLEEETSDVHVSPTEAEPLRNSLRIHRRLIYQIASAAAILLIGMYIGQHMGKTPPEQPLSEHVVEIPYHSPSIRHYLERSETILLGLVNFESDPVTPDAIDLYHLKHVSRQLVQEAEPLRVQLTQPEQQLLRELISDLEVILLQISNLEAKQDVLGIDLVKSSVNRKAILLRINLEEIQQLDAETTSLSNSVKTNL